MRFPLFAGTLTVGLTIGSGCGSANNSGSKLTAFTQQMVAAKRVTIWSTRSNLDGPIGSEFSSVAQIREYMTTGRPPTKSLPYLTKPEAITKSKRDSIAEFFRRVAFERSPEKQHACMFNPRHFILVEHQDKQMFSMLCFQCGDYVVEDEKGTSLFSGALLLDEKGAADTLFGTR
jgi:hypothetical protein